MLFLGTALSILAAVLVTVKEGPVYEWTGVVRMATTVINGHPAPIMPPAEVASFIKVRAAATEERGAWSRLTARQTTEARLDGSTGTVVLAVKGKSAEDARDVLVEWPHVLNAAYKNRLDEGRKRIEGEKDRLRKEGEYNDREVSRLEIELAFLRPLIQFAPDLAVAYGRLNKQVGLRKQQGGGTQRELADLGARERGLGEFDVVPATAAPVRIGYENIPIRMVRAAIWGAGGILCLFVLMDVWKAGSPGAGERPKG